MSLLEVSNLKLGYDGDVVVDDISLSVEEEDFILIKGPNGVGKSTLIKGILGLIKPISGTISFNDINKKYVGYMPQETHVDANFPASVKEIILSGALNSMGLRPFYSKKEYKRLSEVLHCLKIEDLKDKPFTNLSGGQRQRVLLARSLMATTKLLILDEPSNNLDSKTTLDFYATLKHLNEHHKIAIMMITHDDNICVGKKILTLDEDGFNISVKEVM